MKKLLLTALAVIMCTTAVSAEWNISEFMIYGSWPWDRNVDDDIRAKALADAGLNVLHADEHQLDVVHKYGMKALVEGLREDDLSKIKGNVDRIKNHPALYGYYIMDEPLHNFDALKTIYDTFYKADPSHPGFINLISLGGDYLTNYMETVQPNILSYDYYQYWWGTEGHFTKLEMYRDAALKADVPYFLYTEVNTSPYGTFGGPKNIRPDNNEERVRQTVFTSLAYGLKGVLWFTARNMFDSGKAELNAVGKDIAKINAELKVMGPTLVKLKSQEVYHTAPLPRGGTELPDDFWLQPTSYLSYGLVMGTFKDDDNLDYVMLSNKNVDIEMEVALEIKRKYPVTAVEQLDKKTGKWIKLNVTEMVSEDMRGKFSLAYDMHHYSSMSNIDTITYADIKDLWHVHIPGRQFVEVSLARGDGELLRITRDMSFDTIRQQKAPGEKY